MHMHLPMQRHAARSNEEMVQRLGENNMLGRWGCRSISKVVFFRRHQGALSSPPVAVLMLFFMCGGCLPHFRILAISQGPGIWYLLHTPFAVLCSMLFVLEQLQATHPTRFFRCPHPFLQRRCAPCHARVPTRTVCAPRYLTPLYAIVACVRTSSVDYAIEHFWRFFIIPALSFLTVHICAMFVCPSEQSGRGLHACTTSGFRVLMLVS